MSIVPANTRSNLQRVLEFAHAIGLTAQQIDYLRQRFGSDVTALGNAIHDFVRRYSPSSEEVAQHNIDSGYISDLQSQHRINQQLQQNRGRIYSTSSEGSVANLLTSEETMGASGTDNPIMNSGGPDSSNGPCGTETQPDAPYCSPIWTRFPNTATAKLKWIHSVILGGRVTNLSGFDAKRDIFDTSQVNNSATAVASGTNVTAAAAGPQEDLAITGTTLDLTTPLLIQVRMTSLYNVLKNFDQATEGNSTGSGLTEYSEPQWLSFFDSKYTYYHVMKCDWHMEFTFWSNNSTLPIIGGFYIIWRYTSQDDPPTQWDTSGNLRATDGWVNTSTRTIVGGVLGNTSTANLTIDDYERMGGWNIHHVTPSTVTLPVHHIKGSYEYGQCRMDMKTLMAQDAHGLDTSVEAWQQTRNVPGFMENLSVIILQDNIYAQTTSSRNAVAMGVRMHATYTAQFKDLQSSYKYPTPALAQTQITDDRQFFWRGGGQS